MERQVIQHENFKPQYGDAGISREEIARELRRQAMTLREEGESAADFWLAEQYETTADLLN